MFLILAVLSPFFMAFLVMAYCHVAEKVRDRYRRRKNRVNRYEHKWKRKAA